MIKKEIQYFISEIADYLIEQHPEEYETGYADYGYYNNGVGMACCGGETTYDEDKAYEDAKKQLLEDIAIYSGKKEGHYNEHLENLLEKVPSLAQILTHLVEKA